jgi:hypothetical protein
MVGGHSSLPSPCEPAGHPPSARQWGEDTGVTLKDPALGTAPGWKRSPSDRQLYLVWQPGRWSAQGEAWPATGGGGFLRRCWELGPESVKENPLPWAVVGLPRNFWA